MIQIISVYEKSFAKTIEISISFLFIRLFLEINCIFYLLKHHTQNKNPATQCSFFLHIRCFLSILKTNRFHTQSVLRSMDAKTNSLWTSCFSNTGKTQLGILRNIKIVFLRKTSKNAWKIILNFISFTKIILRIISVIL